MATVALGVEWAKAKARANRWEEEVILLDEEMRRVLEFCTWKASWWKKDFLRKDLPGPLAEGLSGYAAEQADVEERIRTAWTTKWASARQLAQPLLWGTAARKPLREAVVGSIVQGNCDGNTDNSDVE